jgi:hypothetical protein
MLPFHLQHSMVKPHFLSNVPGNLSEYSTATELCRRVYLDGVPTETFRQLCWNVLVDTLPITKLSTISTLRKVWTPPTCNLKDPFTIPPRKPPLFILTSIPLLSCIPPSPKNTIACLQYSLSPLTCLQNVHAHFGTWFWAFASYVSTEPLCTYPEIIGSESLQSQLSLS